jgi:alpha-tubulin suppressor-like RCC1 family protein
VEGAAWLFGRNNPSALGIPNADVISENAPRKLIPADLGAADGTKFVHAACGRNHSLLVGSDGEVWSAGTNNLGQVCASFVRFEIVIRILTGLTVRASHLSRDFNL